MEDVGSWMDVVLTVVDIVVAVRVELAVVVIVWWPFTTKKETTVKYSLF